MPVFSDCSMISATLTECTSPAEPPATVKSWLARWTSRPSTDAAPVTTPSAGKLLVGHAEQRCAVLGEQTRFPRSCPESTSAVDPLAGGQLALFVLLLELVGAAAQLHLLARSRSFSTRSPSTLVPASL